MNKVIEKLIYEATKDMQTIMIGELDRFERVFAYLWGSDADINTLSLKELQFRDMWQDVRTQILDFGNDKIREFKEKMINFNETGSLYTMKFNMRSKKNERI